MVYSDYNADLKFFGGIQSRIRILLDSFTLEMELNELNNLQTKMYTNIRYGSILSNIIEKCKTFWERKKNC